MSPDQTTLVEITGNCCYCGKWLGAAAYAAQEVVAVVGREGVVVLCAAHVDQGRAGPDYAAAVRAMASAKAKQLREAAE